MANSSDHKTEDYNYSYKQQGEEGEDQGLLCKLQNVNIIKVRSFVHDDDDHTMMDGCDDDEGYKTPTKKEHRIKVDLTCPPPAPMKPKARPMKRRRPTRRTLFQVSPQDFDLIFTPRSSSSSSSASTSTSLRLPKDADRTHLDSSKVNQPNLTSLVSFR